MWSFNVALNNLLNKQLNYHACSTSVWVMVFAVVKAAVLFEHYLQHSPSDITWTVVYWSGYGNVLTALKMILEIDRWNTFVSSITYIDYLICRLHIHLYHHTHWTHVNIWIYTNIDVWIFIFITHDSFLRRCSSLFWIALQFSLAYEYIWSIHTLRNVTIGI